MISTRRPFLGQVPLLLKFVLSEAALAPQTRKSTKKIEHDVQEKIVDTMAHLLKEINKDKTPTQQWLQSIAQDIDHVPADQLLDLKRDIYLVIQRHQQQHPPPPPYALISSSKPTGPFGQTYPTASSFQKIGGRGHPPLFFPSRRMPGQSLPPLQGGMAHSQWPEEAQEDEATYHTL